MTRRRDPDALTPREQQVFALLKRGYSNRDIAEELGISLAGAKYHVSEIISKLGVSSREEAAAWRPRRRWAFAPMALLGGNGGTVFAPGKLAISAAVLVLLIGAGAVALSAGREVEPSALLAPSNLEPTPTPEPCPTVEGQQGPGVCYRVAKQQLSSWSEASSIVPFPVREPAYIPAGYRHESLLFAYPAGASDQRVLRSSTLFAKYIAGERQLLVNQGYSVGASFAYVAAPEPYRGTVEIAGIIVSWVNGHTVWEERNGAGYPTDRWDESTLGDFTVFWEEPRTGPIAWEKAPGGTVTYHRSGMPVGTLIYGPGLPLEELLKVAESMLSE
jgi:DNA-binding CsgD family transcriptional regulator